MPRLRILHLLALTGLIAALIPLSQWVYWLFPPIFWESARAIAGASLTLLGLAVPLLVGLYQPTIGWRVWLLLLPVAAIPTVLTFGWIAQQLIIGPGASSLPYWDCVVLMIIPSLFWTLILQLAATLLRSWLSKRPNQ